jgi:hypothetical protein
VPKKSFTSTLATDVLQTEVCKIARIQGRKKLQGGISRKWKRGQKPAKEEKVITKEGNTRLQYSRAQWGMIKKKMELW